MTDPIEAAARGIYAAHVVNNMPVIGARLRQWNDLAPVEREVYRHLARCAIAAYKAAMLEQHMARYEEFVSWLDGLPTEPPEKLKQLFQEAYIPWNEAQGAAPSDKG